MIVDKVSTIMFIMIYTFSLYLDLIVCVVNRIYYHHHRRAVHVCATGVYVGHRLVLPHGALKHVHGGVRFHSGGSGYVIDDTALQVTMMTVTDLWFVIYRKHHRHDHNHLRDIVICSASSQSLRS